MSRTSRQSGAAAALALLLGIAGQIPAAAKTPGTTYCYLGICHRVLTLEETAARVGTGSIVVASHYDVPWRDPFNPSLYTSSGEVFRADSDDSAASPVYPDGTRLLVWEPESGGAAVVRVNNAGPYYTDRMLDLSRGAAEKLGLAARGVGRVEVMVLTAPMPEEAAYVAGRVYDPVPGYLGAYPSLAEAYSAWRVMPESQGKGPPVTFRSIERNAASGATTSAGRVVVIPAYGQAARGRRGAKVVLLPVKQRRMAMLRAVAAKRAVTAKRQAAGH